MDDAEVSVNDIACKKLIKNAKDVYNTIVDKVDAIIKSRIRESRKKQ